MNNIKSFFKIPKKDQKILLGAEWSNEDFEGLLHYTIYHFSTEEEFWMINDETIYLLQKKEYDNFVNALGEIGDIKILIILNET